MSNYSTGSNSMYEDESKNDAFNGDNLLNQITNITKAHGFDILSEQVKELKTANEKLSSENRVLRQHIKLILDDNYQLPAWKRKQLEAALNTKQ